MKNQPKGYNGGAGEKENLKLPSINDKSYLQNRGAAILAAGNKYKPEAVNITNNNPRVLNQIYGSNNAASKPPVYNYKYNNGYIDRSNV